MQEVGVKGLGGRGERERIWKSWPQILFSFKRGGKCLSGLTNKTKGNLINTVNSAPKVFASNIFLLCGTVIRRLERKKKSWGCLFKKVKKKPKQQGKMFNLIIFGKQLHEVAFLTLLWKPLLSHQRVPDSSVSLKENVRWILHTHESF